MATPTIFTQTPIESVILANGLKIQEALASVFLGTPVFKSIAFACIMFVIIFAVLKMRNGEINHQQASAKIVKHIFLFVIAFGLLANGSISVNYSSLGEQQTWSSYPKINSDSKFSSLSQDSNGLDWYLKFYRGFQELSNLATEAISGALHDPTVSKDPTFVYKTLGNAAIKGLDDKDTAISFNALISNCSDTKLGKKMDKNSSLKDLFELTKPGCFQIWNEFSNNLSRVTNAFKSAYSDQIYADVFAGRLKGMDPQTMANFATANALTNHINALSGYTSSINKTNNITSTYSDNTADQVAMMTENPVRDFALYFTNMLGVTQKDSFMVANKAEIASIFNQIAYLIPVSRAYFQLFLSLVYLLAILVLGCGNYKFFIAWLTSMFLISMYQPVSVLVYQLPIFLSNQQTFLNNSHIVSTDPLFVVGARLVSEQVTQMQTVSIAMQIVVYMFFLLGSVKVLGMVTQASGKLGATIGGYGERLISAVPNSLSKNSNSSSRAPTSKSNSTSS